MDIRYVCVFLAPVFSTLTCFFAYLLAYEITGRYETGLLSALFISVMPTYISWSVAGSFDNEAISITLLLSSFYLFLKACKQGSIFWAIGAAMSYAYLVASWGGYSFVITFIPIFVLGTLLTGRYSAQIYVGYTTFYVIANMLAI